MTNTNLPKELVRLATGCINNKIRGEELADVIKNILVTNDYVLDEILEECMDYTSNFEVVQMLQGISEQLSYSKKIFGKDGHTYFANLFAIPIVFVKKEGTTVDSIEEFVPELEKIGSYLRKTKVFDHECSIHIHHQLFSPEQLMLLNYNYIYSFLNEMSNVCFNKPANIVSAPEFEQQPSDGNTLYVRYLFGVRVFKQEAATLSPEQEYAVLSDFNEKAAPILSKIIDGYNLSVIGVDEFYPAIQVGLEFYTSLSRRIDVEQLIVNNNILAEYCVAFITMDLDNIEDSFIEIRSSITDDILGTAQIYPLKYQEPKDLIGAITDELAEIGFELENINIRADGEVYPIDFFLKFEDDIEIATNVNNFLDNPDIDD